MKRHLQLVILEDNEDDLQLVVRELYKNGFSVYFKHTESRQEFLDELKGGTPDLILSDHGYPSFDGFTALALAKQWAPQTPFIFVTGVLNESLAIEAFRRGAADYVLKNRLSELSPAVERVLVSPERTAPENSVQGSVEAKPMITACASCKQVRTVKGTWISLDEYLERTYGLAVTHGYCRSCIDELYPKQLKRPRL